MFFTSCTNELRKCSHIKLKPSDGIGMAIVRSMTSDINDAERILE